VFTFDGFHCCDCDCFRTKGNGGGYCTRLTKKRWPGDSICRYFVQGNDNDGEVILDEDID